MADCSYRPDADWTLELQCDEAGYLQHYPNEYEYCEESQSQDCFTLTYNTRYNGQPSPAHSVSSYESSSCDGYQDNFDQILLDISENVQADDILLRPQDDFQSDDLDWDLRKYSFNPDEKFNSLALESKQAYSEGLPSVKEAFIESAWKPPAESCRFWPSDTAMNPSPAVKYEPQSRRQIPKHQPKLTLAKPRRTNKRAKGHLWEFVLELLKNEKHNPKVVKWEDRKRGIFRFMDSKEASRLWGERKGNDKMTYEKMSRAMRYYYQRAILIRIDGKRLVYQFGPNSGGWM